ncbi:MULTISPECIES: LysR family transcriptional regulator [Rhodomicrobium]|uniref:LysR family transcriptional regulator n=1 Tax=Rhodomicrobium TaxID=1068 RepID=UPI000B4B8A44|nr:MULTISPECIES: LysR family transcriptional regulator [Rhodomicrobium]
MIDARKNLGWDDFRLIKAVADTRSLPAAADRLGINHSTVFRRLKQIEDALGAELFEKHRSGYALTPAGEEVAALAARVDEDITAVTRKLAGREVAPSGELRVATNDSLLVHLLTPLFAQFRERCPEVRLDILIGNQALNLAKRDADVAIRATDNPPETLVGRRAARLAWALYGRANDFPNGAPAGREALAGANWVSLSEQFGGFKAVKWVLAQVPQERLAYRLNTVLGLAEAVEAGIGVGHLPCFIGDAKPSLIRLAPPNPDYATSLWLLTHPDLRNSARVRVFLDFLAEAIAKRRKFIEGEGDLIQH